MIALVTDFNNTMQENLQKSYHNHLFLGGAELVGKSSEVEKNQKQKRRVFVLLFFNFELDFIRSLPFGN